MTSWTAPVSKLMQSTAIMITRSGALDGRAAGADGPSLAVPGPSLPICSADTTRRRRPLMVTENFSGPRLGTGRPVESITWTSTATTSTLTRIRGAWGCCGS